MDRLFGKTMILSGASSGIGRKFAEELAINHNCKIIAIARDESKINDLNEFLKDRGCALYKYYLFDVAEEGGWANLRDSLVGECIKIDAVINCAGFLPPFKKFDKFTIEEYRRIFDVDFYSCVYSVKYTLPLIEHSDFPAIINVSSSSALCTFAGISGYSAAKSALKSFTLSLAEEYRGKIYFGCVCPGFTKTNIFSNLSVSDEEFKITQKLSSDCEKIVKKSIKKINAKKPLIIVGYDAKLMNFFYKTAPITTAKVISRILRKSKLKLFKEI